MSAAPRFELPLPDLAPWRAGNTGVEGVWHFDSGQPGRALMITALIHGNELCGAWALKGLLEAGLRPVRGTLTLAFCNLAAFDRFDADRHDAARFVEQDLNRQWTPERLRAADSLERRRAAGTTGGAGPTHGGMSAPTSPQRPAVLVARAIFPDIVEQLSRHIEVESNPDDTLWPRAELVRRLAATAEVFIENFRPGVVAHCGLDYESIRAVRPDIVYCSISGYGQQGAWAGRGAYDHVMQALTGMMLMSGASADAPPIKVGFPVIDVAVGMLGALSVSAALHRRARTGEGQHIDASMLQASMMLMYPNASSYLTEGVEPQRAGNRGYTGSPTADTYRCADGWAVAFPNVGSGEGEVTVTAVFEAEGQFWIPKDRTRVCGNTAAQSEVPAALFKDACQTN